MDLDSLDLELNVVLELNLWGSIRCTSHGEV